MSAEQKPDRATLEQAEVKAWKIGRLIGGQMPKGWGFTLILSSYGEKGFLTYISNIQRDGMIKTLRETADQLESGEAQC
jgi:hypothetical protein